jgi:hypothetical protein
VVEVVVVVEPAAADQDELDEVCSVAAVASCGITAVAAATAASVNAARIDRAAVHRARDSFERCAAFIRACVPLCRAP